MGRSCVVKGCGNRYSRDNVSFFRVPKLLERRANAERQQLSRRRQRAWFNSVGRNDLTPAQFIKSYVCEEHFSSGKPADLTDSNNIDWVPTQKLNRDDDFVEYDVEEAEAVQAHRPGGTSDQQELNPNDPDIPLQIYMPEESVHPELYIFGSENEHISSEGPELQLPHASSQTDMTGENIDQMNQEILQLQEEVHCLKAEVQKCKIDELFFKGDDEKVKYFTGLPTYILLMSVFELVSPFITCPPNSPCTKFMRFILTLMKLRLNLDFKYLAYQFNISPTTASTVFYSCTNVMYFRLKGFVRWPEREEMRCRVPAPFLKAFGRAVTVIIDCFEVFIETPANVLAQAQCFSNYKHHHTIKYMIAITVQGFIAFISDAYGGRSSDKFVTEDCGLLNNLLPGDLILADRGFTVENAVQFYRAQLKTPAFTKGAKQMRPFDIEETRKLASVRIHVERVIGVVRQKFTILSGELPISVLAKNGSSVSPLDQIVTVCCALFNLCPPIISVE